MPQIASPSPAPPRPAGTPSTPPPEAPPGPWWKRWIVPALLLAIMAGWQFSATREEVHPSISYTSFYTLVTNDKLQEVTIKGLTVTGKLKAQETVEGKPITSFRSMLPPQEDRDLLPLLRQKGVAISVKSEEQPPALQLLFAILPWVLIIGVWFWLSRRAQDMMAGRAAGIGNLIKGHTRRFDKSLQVNVKFDDVAGLKAPKQDLQEIVEFLKEPEQFRRLGGKVPRGVLLIGPPGTGKTLLARAVAGEAGVPFFSISGSEFIEMFVGVGASRVRELFEEAKKVAPAIIFIDKIDAVGRSRGTGLGGGHDEREQTLNQLLSEMDGFSRNDLTIVLAATNRPDVLDAALLRPGRFDRRVVIDRPELAARKAILEVHARGKPLAPDVDLKNIAATTPGFSGADLANLVNEAALNATRRRATAIEAQDFTAAFEKIVLGDPRETKLDAEEKRRVAVHESGHAVVAHFTPHAEPLERVSIIPRGMALGVTQQTPAADRHIMTQPELESRLQVLMGGYAAEMVMLGDISSGAENDLKKATELAFKMVANFGMSELVGPVFHEHRTEHPFLGQMLATEGSTSDATVHVIEQETRRMLAEAAASAKQTITAHRAEMEVFVARLLEQETVERHELTKLLGPPVTAGRDLPPTQDPAPVDTLSEP